MRFPREMWAGSLRSNAREASRIVVNSKEEYNDFIKTYNGKMNVFTSVYDYEFLRLIVVLNIQLFLTVSS